MKSYNSKKNPYIVKIFEACMSHIAYKDETLLKRSSGQSEDIIHNPTLVIYPFEYGYFIVVDWADANSKADYIRLEKEGYSKEFINLIKIARKNKVKFLQLDGDGIEYEDLPTFNSESQT